MNHSIHIPVDQITRFCEANHIRRLAVFGSAVHGDFGPTSDIDLLVEFDSSKTPGFRFFDLQEELSQILGRRVDLNTPGFLSRHFREKVAAEAVPIYVASER